MFIVLFVKLSDCIVEEGVLIKFYEVFLVVYKENNFVDEVVELDFYKENFFYFGRDMINGIFKVG